MEKMVGLVLMACSIGLPIGEALREQVYGGGESGVGATAEGQGTKRANGSSGGGKRSKSGRCIWAIHLAETQAQVGTECACANRELGAGVLRWHGLWPCLNPRLKVSKAQLTIS